MTEPLSDDEKFILDIFGHAGPKVIPPDTEIPREIRRHLYLPDDTPLVAICGAVAANLLEADPVWLLLVGAPGW